MYKRFNDRGLMVLAVNAWNEPKADVARYVRNNRLSYRILLNGAEMGRKLYGVTQLPANFWINKSGEIVHQLSGSGEYDLKRMEKWTEEVL